MKKIARIYEPKFLLFFMRIAVLIALMRDDVTRFGANIKSRLGGDEIRGNIKLCVGKI